MHFKYKHRHIFVSINYANQWAEEQVMGKEKYFIYWTGLGHKWLCSWGSFLKCLRNIAVLETELGQ